MAEDLRQLHVEGMKVRRGPAKLVDISGNKPGEYGRYAGNTVVPRSSDTGRLENGVVFPKVKHRSLNKDFQVEFEEMVSPIVDPLQRSLDDQLALSQGIISSPDLDFQSSDEEKAAVIRKVIEEDAEIERKLALEQRIREQVAQNRAEAAPRQQPPSELVDAFREIRGMFNTMQEQIDDLRLERGVAPRPKPLKAKDGLVRVTFSGDFGSIRAAYREIVSGNECIVLGSPGNELQSYEPPVNPQKAMQFTVDGQDGPPLHVVHAGLSFDYKGDRLTVLLLDNTHGDS